MVLPFWYRLIRVVPDKGPLKGCTYLGIPRLAHSQYSKHYLYFTVSVRGKQNEQHAMSVVQLVANPTVCRSSTDPPGATLDWDGVGYLVLFVFHSVGVW